VSFGNLRFLCQALLVTFLAAVSVRGFGVTALPVTAATPTPQLSAAGETQLQAILDVAELADLRWPAFSNYRSEVTEFYSSSNGSLPWIYESGPSTQALAIIQILKNSDQEGLDPEDYDGPRWESRMAALAQPCPAPESDLVRFDVAVTVSAMRYVSDVHWGRLNPHLFHFEFDMDHASFDLSEYLRDKLVNASETDIEKAIEAIEPPFPTYHRTLSALRTYLELARRDDGELLPVPPKAIRPGDAYAGLPPIDQASGPPGRLSRNREKS
jgi:murein L,D-transpeptidase YcbB/YkuD